MMIVERIYIESPVDDPANPRQWPFNLSPVAQILRDGLVLTHPVTFLVGENGSGKSTIVEALAEAYGLDVRGGHAGRRYATTQPKGALGQRLKFAVTSEGARMKGRKTKGFFLRAETALGVFEFMSDYGVPGYGDKHLGTVSHGEGFLQVFRGRFKGAGLYLMDEPEAALSFSSCLALVKLLDELASEGAQIVCATHSPILAALPGAQILEVSDNGINPTSWEELALVDHWRRYLASPAIYLGRLLS